jgi:hypothetical protein
VCVLSGRVPHFSHREQSTLSPTILEAALLKAAKYFGSRIFISFF